MGGVGARCLPIASDAPGKAPLSLGARASLPRICAAGKATPSSGHDKVDADTPPLGASEVDKVLPHLGVGGGGVGPPPSAWVPAGLARYLSAWVEERVGPSPSVWVLEGPACHLLAWVEKGWALLHRCGCWRGWPEFRCKRWNRSPQASRAFEWRQILPLSTSPATLWLEV